MTVFDRIKKVSKIRGYSLQDTAEKSGLSKNAIYQYNNGKNPSTHTLTKIADVLGVSVDYLLGNTDEMHPSKSEDNSAIDLRQVDDSERDELISANGQPISDSDWEIIKAVLAKYERHED